MIVGAPVGFRYFASLPEDWTHSAKALAHLRELNLPALFSSYAGSRLSEIRARLGSLHHKGGERAVHGHLREELASIDADHKNSWVAAMYRVAVATDWFFAMVDFGDVTKVRWPRQFKAVSNKSQDPRYPTAQPEITGWAVFHFFLQ